MKKIIIIFLSLISFSPLANSRVIYTYESIEEVSRTLIAIELCKARNIKNNEIYCLEILQKDFERDHRR